MMRWTWVTVGVFSLACSGEPDAVDKRESRLIGGYEVSDTEFPSTVKIWSGCTATKVGPRHFLTVAHCALGPDGIVNSRMADGAQNWVTNHRQPTNSVPPYIPVTIEHTYIHPAWVASCHAHLAQNPGGACTATVLFPEHAPDVAVVVIEELTPGIPEAAIDITPVEVNDEVVVLGYGCTDPDKTGGGTLKAETVPVLPVTALDHPNAFNIDDDDVYASYVITSGYSADPTHASLCPGDSGGPIFRADTEEELVVGVNAYYSFPGDWNVYASLTNWHTRVDVESRYEVDEWLEGIPGLNIVGPDPGGTGGAGGASGGTGGASGGTGGSTGGTGGASGGTGGTGGTGGASGGSGGGTGGPCDGICAAPTIIGSSSFQSGNLGSGASCYETTHPISSGVCGAFAAGRTIEINETAIHCASGITPPAPRNGGYCIDVSAGDHAWAWFSLW